MFQINYASNPIVTMSLYQTRILCMTPLLFPSFFTFSFPFHLVTVWELLHLLAILREKYMIRFKYESSYTLKCSNPLLIPSPWILELYLSILSTKQPQICSTVIWLANMLMMLKLNGIQTSQHTKIVFARVKLNNPCYVYKIPFVEK